MKPEAQSDQATWSDIEEQIEPALDHLSSADRQAILLRFYRQLTHAEMAATLAITEEAAKKRVNRALDRLRQYLVKTGATASSLAVGPMLLAHAVHPAPVALAAKLAAAGTTATVSSEIATLVKGIQHMFHLAKLKFAALTITASAALIGIATLPVVLGQANAPATSPPADPAAAAIPQSMPATTGKAIYATPIDALRAFNHALATLDSAEFANAVDAAGDDEKTSAAQLEQLLTAGHDLRIALLKKFPDDEVTAAVTQGLGMGLLPLTPSGQPNAQVPFDTFFTQGQEDECVVLLQKGSTGLPLIKRNGSWRFQFFKLQKLLSPANAHDLPNTTPATIQAQVDAKVATINETRIAFEKGTLTNLEEIPARLQNAAPATQR